MSFKRLITGLMLTILLSLISVSSLASAQEQTPIPTPIPDISQGTRALQWSPDGTLLAVAEPMGNITIRDIDGEIVYSLLAHENAVRDISWSSDSRHLVSTGRDETLKIWSMSDGSLSRTIDTASEGIGGSAYRVSWQPAADLILASGLDTIGVWNAADGALVTSFGGVTILDLEWDPSGTLFAFVAMGGVGVVEFVRGRDGITRFDYPVLDPRFNPPGVDWNEQGTQVVTGGGEDGSVRLWNPQTGEQVRVLLQVSAAVTSAIFVDDDSVAAAANDGQIYILNTETGLIEQTIAQAAQVWAMAWNPQAELLAVGGLAPDAPTTSAPTTSGADVEASALMEDSGLLNLIPLPASA